MKKIILSALLFLPAFCLASFDLSQWQYYKNTDIQSVGLYRVSLDDEIFSNAKGDLSDLRVIDNDNAETPFKMMVVRGSQKIDVFNPVMINNSFVPGENSSVVLDMGTGIIINQLRIITNSENFQRNVVISGSDSIGGWKILSSNSYIYDYTDRQGSFKSQNTTVNFPQSVFRYIKLEISDPEGSPIKITGVEGINYTKEASKEIKRNPKFSASENDKDKLTEIIIDLGSKGIPNNKAQLITQDKNFNRAVLIYTSNNSSDWKYNSNGYIFRYQTPKFSGENLDIGYAENNDQYIKLVIQNKDNQPLSIDGLAVYSTYREIVFQADGGKSYKVFYGNNKARLPEYDLDAYFQYLDLETAKSASLSKEIKNANFIPEKEPLKPISERIPFLFPTALAICALILLFLVYKFFQK